MFRHPLPTLEIYRTFLRGLLTSTVILRPRATPLLGQYTGRTTWECANLSTQVPVIPYS